ncbi:kinase-like protein [Gigaspora margarita]|uniref:Kinase-like protein n=1 Tax=Gigaspora margarita TaxID=4874 RepID=A0A8H4ASU4_GIGMA|nr:kinase-like protein [Gigaspora margarita]
MSYKDFPETIVKQIDYASFEDKEEISKGKFGATCKAYKAYLNDIKQVVALKTLYYYDEKSLFNWISKVRHTTYVYHRNIIQFLGITQDSETRTYYMVLQYANSGNLQCYLNDHFSNLDWFNKIRMAKEISSGISFLHGADIIHQNLHDKNILVHDGRMIITDFGLLESFDNSTKSVTSRVHKKWEYFDPQYLQSPLTYKLDKRSDIYSLGVLFWELSSGLPPFRSLKAHHVISGDREISIEGTPTDFKNLYCAAWNGNPDNRPDIKKICEELKEIPLKLFCKDFPNFKYSFSEKEKIGKGGFGEIHKVYLEDIKQNVALKSLNRNDDEGFIREVKCTTKVNHDNIIKFFGITQDPEKKTYYMILHYANSGDLECYLKDCSSKLNWSTIIRMAKEISSGVNYLHGANIIHLDLHDKNILVHEGRMIITDFGLSKLLDDGTESISGEPYGRCEYCDPSYLPDPLKYKWNKRSDIFSIGVLFWELSSGVPPFINFKKSPTKISWHYLKGERETPIKGTPFGFQKLYDAAWNGDPDCRPNIKEICNKLDQIRLEIVYDQVLYYSFMNFSRNVIVEFPKSSTILNY